LSKGKQIKQVKITDVVLGIFITKITYLM